MSESAPEDVSEIAAPPVVVVDVNEPTGMVGLLEARGVRVDRRRLAPADYVVGPIAIERKTIGDFHASMLKQRLFEQLTRLKETYPAPVMLLLEGDPAGFEELQNPRASYGALLAISIDLGVTVVPTGSREASADLLSTLANRVGRTGWGHPDIRFRPRMLGPSEQQKFVVQGLPGIGDVVSESLLSHFGSLRRLFAASEKELLRAPGIGKKRAREVTDLLDRPFEGRQRRLPRS